MPKEKLNDLVGELIPCIAPGSKSRNHQLIPANEKMHEKKRFFFARMFFFSL